MIKKFSFKGKTYQLDPKFFDESMLNTSLEFQYSQFMYLIKAQDWITLENRIINQLKHGGLIEITKTEKNE
jgi:hypothetical protein